MEDTEHMQDMENMQRKCSGVCIEITNFTFAVCHASYAYYFVGMS